MNFYTWSHSTYESNKEEYMEFSRKCYIGCMPDYTYDDYVYFNNMNDTQNKHNNNFILNKIPDFHITSPLKWCGDIFESLPKLFLDKMKISIFW